MQLKVIVFTTRYKEWRMIFMLNPYLIMFDSLFEYITIVRFCNIVFLIYEVNHSKILAPICTVYS